MGGETGGLCVRATVLAPRSGDKQLTRLPVGGDNNDDANVHNDDGGGLHAAIQRHMPELNPQAHGGMTAIALGSGQRQCAC